MNQLALNHRLDRDGVCSELVNMAQRELGAFFKAVTELFGAEQAELSAEDWLHEVEESRTLPGSPREWRRVTSRVIAQLANRVVTPIPAGVQLQPVGF